MIAPALGQRFGLKIFFGHPESVRYLERGVASASVHLRLNHRRPPMDIQEWFGWVICEYLQITHLNGSRVSCIAAVTLHGEKSIAKNKSLHD